MSSRNQEVIDLFADLVRLATLDEGGPSFRVRAYENAQREMEEFRGELADMTISELVKIDGIGKSTAQKIREYYDSGKISKLEELRKKYPPAFVELTRIPGLGPKSVLTLRDKLGIENIDQLRVALEAEKIRELKGFGKKTEENIARALERMGGLGKNKRRSIAEALPLAESLVARLEAMEVVEKATYCGSLRRFRETIGDIDIVAIATDSGAVMDAFTSFEEVEEIVGQGDTKSSVIVGGGLQVDLRVVAPDQYGAAVLYFTGSKAHNIKLRQRAIARTWTLNEYGLTEVESGKVVASETEEEIYRALELEPIAPPMREDHGEVEASAAHSLIAIVRPEDVTGEWGIDVAGLKSAVDSEYSVCLVPAAEFESRSDSPPAGMQVVWAATYELGQPVPEMPKGADLLVARVPSAGDADLTGAFLAAAASRDVRAVFGGSGRIITEDEGGPFDAEAVGKVLAESETLWIIDCDLRHLDPGAETLRKVRDLGVTFALGSGSSAAGGPWAARTHGPKLCQRAWIDRSSVANTWPFARVREWL